jgi:hypothetical protein
MSAAIPKHVAPGDRLNIRAATWNALGDLLRKDKQGQPKDSRRESLRWGGVVEAMALNSTGADIREYKPATVTDAGGYELPTNDSAWQRKPLLTIDVPGATTDFVVVTLEAIPSGQIGRVAVAGVVLCDVDTSAGSDYGTPAVGDTDRLTGGTSGPIRILHVPASVGSTKRCVVSLSDQTASVSGGGGVALLTVNSDTTDNEPATDTITADLTTGIEFDEGTNGDGNTTLKLLAASATQQGAVTISSQTFEGAKTFRDAVTVNSENNTGTAFTAYIGSTVGVLATDSPGYVQVLCFGTTYTGVPTGTLQVNGYLDSSAITIHAFDSNYLTKIMQFTVSDGAGKFQMLPDTSSGAGTTDGYLVYYYSTKVWQFGQIVEAKTRFRVNGTDGATGTIAVGSVTSITVNGGLITGWA